MELVTVAEIVFAVAATVAAVSVAAAVFDRAPRFAVATATGLLVAGTIALWTLYVVHRRTPVAVSAGGGTIAMLAGIAALKIRSLLAQARRIDDQLDRAVARLSALIARETADRTAELERTLARARADSTSALVEQERQIAEERRRAASEREREAVARMADALGAAQRQMDQRFQSWAADLDRLQRAVTDQLALLGQRQRQLISDAETRIAADAERLEAESEQQRDGLMRLRDELARAIEETVSTGNAELETYAADRRRALHELNERLRRREREFVERVEREEADASRRLEAAFAGVERRQVEQLERVLARTTASFSEAAAKQFGEAIRSAREGAATRLSRELDRAVQAFAREAERVLAERLAAFSDVGAQRLEKRLAQVSEGLERQRASAIAAFEERLSDAEQELRRRIEGLSADADAERAVLEARLRELARRIDETIARA